MPTFLGPRWPANVSRRPTHMSTEDYAIWQRWYPTVRAGVRGLYFDVGLGDGAPADNHVFVKPNMLRMWQRLTQRRADVLIDYGSSLWLVELRYMASPSAIGRLLTYAALWKQDPVLPGDLSLHLVSNVVIADTKTLTEKFHILFHIA